MENNGKGAYRRQTPKEIGEEVAALRKLAGKKQYTLANEAGLQERTVQHVEHGEKVSVDTLHKIAKAFRFPEDHYIKTYYFPTAAELEAAAERMTSKTALIEAASFSGLKDCEAVLAETDGYIFNDRHVTDAIWPRLSRSLRTCCPMIATYTSIFHTPSAWKRVAPFSTVPEALSKRAIASGAESIRPRTTAGSWYFSSRPSTTSRCVT